MNNSLQAGIAGGIRPMTARWVITADMALQTAAHFGGTGDGSADMEILRDPKEGFPLLPGTSLAGALRSHLSDVLGGYYKEEHKDVSLLFGASRRDEQGTQSPLIVFDSFGRLPDGMTEEIRDGVAIDPETGTAMPRKKFDMEVIPAGTVFPLRLDVIIGKPEEESPLLSLLVKALDGLTVGDISLGARRSRGLGAVIAGHWSAVRYDLTTPDGWLNWLTSDTLHPIADDSNSSDKPKEAFEGAYHPIKWNEIADERNRLLVDAELFFTAGILVRSPAITPDAPDSVHLISGGRSVLPGTSLAGVLRNRALRIARIVHNGKDDAEARVNCLFGSPLEAEQEDKHLASRLRISESAIMEGRRMRPSRIRLDRFTQGVVRGALFDEEPDYYGKGKVRFELRDPKSGESGLLLLLLKDLLSGDLYIGGAAAVGRGAVKGTASVCFENGKEAKIGAGLEISGETRELFQQKIAELHEGGTV